MLSTCKVRPAEKEGRQRSENGLEVAAPGSSVRQLRQTRPEVWMREQVVEMGHGGVRPVHTRRALPGTLKAIAQPGLLRCSRAV